MHNVVYLIGRLTKDPELKELENGSKVISANLAVQRSFKNGDGVYETDFVDCAMWNGIAENVSNYCHKGYLIGVKGRLQVIDYEKNGEKKKNIEVVCEKVSFLAPRKNEIDEDLDVN